VRKKKTPYREPNFKKYPVNLRPCEGCGKEFSWTTMMPVGENKYACRECYDKSKTLRERHLKYLKELGGIEEKPCSEEEQKIIDAHFEKIEERHRERKVDTIFKIRSIALSLQKEVDELCDRVEALVESEINSPFDGATREDMKELDEKLKAFRKKKGGGKQ